MMLMARKNGFLGQLQCAVMQSCSFIGVMISKVKRVLFYVL